ncbi:MAG: hypothetical protein LEGION0398_MBIBDBAK_00678 [Legionellaceae bacterium]
MLNSSDFENIKKLVENEVKIMEPIYAEVIEYAKSKEKDNANDIIEKLNFKKNKIDFENEMTSLPTAIETTRNIYDYLSELEQILIQRRLFEAKPEIVENFKIESNQNNESTLMQRPLPLTEKQAKGLSEHVEKEIKEIDEKIKLAKNVTELSNSSPSTNKSSDLEKVDSIDLLTRIRFAKYKIDFLFFSLQKANLSVDGKEKLEKEKEEAEKVLSSINSNIAPKKHQITQDFNTYNSSAVTLAKIKLSYFEKLMTRDKNSIAGKIIKGLINIIPRLAASIKKSGEKNYPIFKK